MVRFEVLGPVQVRGAGGEATAVGGLQALLLAMLLAHRDQAVSADRLIDVMWGSAADSRAKHRLQTHVHRLRRLHGQQATVAAEAGSYRLSLPAGSLDAALFESAVAQSPQADDHDPDQTVRRLREALAHWRGEPYEGLDAPELRTEARRLQELRLSAVEQLYGAELACGRHDVVARELPPILAAHPLREGLHELVMMSLAMGGRQADALAAYRHARSLLVDELGIDPGPRLRELEMQILNGEQVGPDVSAMQIATVPIPAQLPVRPSGFVGRLGAFDKLNTLLDDEAGSATLVTLTGSAGVGKTAAAVHWAHATSHQFPHGQLYVDLHGYGPDQPLAPAQVLGSFLRALGVKAQSIPDELHERAARFRSEVAGRRLLILLDNARNAAQVRPLLPGTDTCATVITSRAVLTSLTVQEGARAVSLERMGDAEARHLLTALLDEAYDPGAVDELAAACARLPLALRVAAERIRTFGHVSLPDLTSDLNDEQLRLDVLDGGDSETSVRGVFSWSYRELSRDAAWVFRCLGRTAAREMSAAAVAAMAGLGPGPTRRALDILVRAHLVEVSDVQRYHQHDLLRSYAAELADEVDGAGIHQAAFARLCDYYSRTAAAAVERFMAEKLSSPEARTILDDQQLPRPFESPAMAARWLEAELENVVLVAEHAAIEGPLSYPTTLSTLLSRYLDVTSLPDHADRVHTAALTAARSSGEINEEGSALRMLGLLGLRRDRLDEAWEYLSAAVVRHQQAGDLRQKADTHNLLAGVAMFAGRASEAIEQMEQAIAEFSTLPGSAGCYSMANYGLLHCLLGRPEEGLRWLESSLKMSEGGVAPHCETASLMNLVACWRELGDYDRALACADRGLILAGELGRRHTEAKILISAGMAHRRLGEFDRGRDHHRRAMAIWRELGHLDDVMVGAHNGLADIARDVGDLQEARRQHVLAMEFVHGHWPERSATLIGLGETYRQLGEHNRAAEAWSEALMIYEKVGHAGTGQLREQLTALHGVPAR
ncbi:MAG TPA: BTAD domain-containing putative transcriptional regulator [Beutenbergiaceae bacterium]|nr:BTAD domain-containing putative transcriptional regulator [Beutenbergiaceae bacterium]